jgi:hydrogenase expression/formation protein HypE
VRLGSAALAALQAEITGRLHVGDELVVAGDIALFGTERLIEENREMLSSRFSRGFLNQSLRVCRENRAVKDGETSQVSVAWKMAKEAGAHALYALGEGGFLSSLWKMAEASQVGLTADLRRVPIRQETIEICEEFDINPYRLESKGALLIGLSGGHALAEKLRRTGIVAEVIGQTTSSNDRMLYSGEHARFLERPAEDELYKRREKGIWQK